MHVHRNFNASNELYLTTFLSFHSSHAADCKRKQTEILTNIHMHRWIHYFDTLKLI